MYVCTTWIGEVGLGVGSSLVGGVFKINVKLLGVMSGLIANNKLKFFVPISQQ